ncbi:Lrp/AsnC family transcriptional regulator [Inquilinus sp. CAU 1745]|uniref:Lrp/AsnC family transcriptional regulator n=1 Tax=Inquilinus sp. CAU 1745 TaxID=3140369 RepID=UPI00325B04F5
MDSKARIDETGWRILDALQENARINFAELGRRVGLSAPAVADRVKRLEEAGIIAGYQARLDRGRAGYGLTAFIRLKPQRSADREIDALVRDMPEILECHQVTGEEGFILKVVARSIAHLDEIILRLAPFGATTSSIVLSTRAEGKKLVQPAS